MESCSACIFIFSPDSTNPNALQQRPKRKRLPTQGRTRVYENTIKTLWKHYENTISFHFRHNSISPDNVFSISTFELGPPRTRRHFFEKLIMKLLLNNHNHLDLHYFSALLPVRTEAGVERLLFVDDVKGDSLGSLIKVLKVSSPKINSA